MYKVHRKGRDGDGLLLKANIRGEFKIVVLCPPAGLPCRTGEVHEVSRVLLADAVDLAKIADIAQARTA